MVNNSTPHLKSLKSQNRRAAFSGKYFLVNNGKEMSLPGFRTYRTVLILIFTVNTDLTDPIHVLRILTVPLV